MALEGAVHALADKYRMYAARHFAPAEDAANGEEEFQVEILSEVERLYKLHPVDPLA